jgi:hypothetical protein
MTQFDPQRILRTLNEHHVAYVVIGGIAARLLGSPSITLDIDVCYERSRPNLEALAAALRSLGATLRARDQDLPFVLDAKTLEFGDNSSRSTPMQVHWTAWALPGGRTGTPISRAAQRAWTSTASGCRSALLTT